MPAKSKAQFRFMEAAAHGGLDNPPKGLTKAKASEYVSGQKNYKSLPEKKNRFKRLKKAMEKK